MPASRLADQPEADFMRQQQRQLARNPALDGIDLRRDRRPTAEPANCGPFASLQENPAVRESEWWRTQSLSNLSHHRNSLLTGIRTGNFAIRGGFPALDDARAQCIKGFPPEFPIQRNREFLGWEQGIPTRIREFPLLLTDEFCDFRFPPESRNQPDGPACPLRAIAAVRVPI